MPATDGAECYREALPHVGAMMRAKTKNICRMQTIKSKFPIIDWLPNYKLKYLPLDFIAGFTVGLTTIPQAIAYGVVAGLEPQYGLYSAFMGCFAYIIFGSCKDVTIATTAIMAIMVQPYASQNPDFAVLICFLAGCIILLLGLLNLGLLVRFISMPVIVGFTIAAATTIASAQINNLFGIKSPSNKFIASWRHFFTHLTTLNWPDALLGVSTLLCLLIMKQARNVQCGSRYFWKYLSLSRNALVVLGGTFLAYKLSGNGRQPFRVTGNITAGLPPIQLPPFHTEVNGTQISFAGMLTTYGPTLGFVPLVAILEIVAIAKAFSQRKIVDASQEMIALGMCNIMASFVLSMPVTGSFTRTAVNNASGVRTPLGGAVTGAFVLLALAFLTQTFYFIPKATLAAIIIAAMLSLIEYETVICIWKTKKLDLLPFIVTLFTCLFWSLEYGILCGVLINGIFVVLASAKPELIISLQPVLNFECGLIEVRQSLDYTAAELLKEQIMKLAIQNPRLQLVIIKGNQINAIDYTVAMNLISLREDLRMLNCDLMCWQWRREALGVLYRAKPAFSDTFQNEPTLEQAVLSHMKAESSCESLSTVLAD